MINKRNLLGKAPFDLGDKDAVHVAIVAMRAGAPIKPGQRCKMNEFMEAVPGDGPGVADPFRKDAISTGDSFWLLMAQDEIPNVRHEWEHPSVAFGPPTRPMARNRTLQREADELGVTYEQLMAACAHVAEHDESAAYPGTLDKDAFEKAIENVERYDIWSEWSDETGHEFYNSGSACCPEYNYPDTPLFELVGAGVAE